MFFLNADKEVMGVTELWFFILVAVTLCLIIVSLVGFKLEHAGTLTVAGLGWGILGLGHLVLWFFATLAYGFYPDLYYLPKLHYTSLVFVVIGLVGLGLTWRRGFAIEDEEREWVYNS